MTTKTPNPLYHLKRLAGVLIRELEQGELKHRAMSLVYTTLLSLAPLLAVSFSVLKAFGIHNQLEPFLRQALAPLGEKSTEITANVIGFVENIQVGVLGFLGFAMLFYTVVSLLSQIEDCFNHIWRIAKPRPLYRRFSDYLSVVLIGPVLLFSALGIAATMGNAGIVQNLISLEPFGTLYYLVGLLLPYVLIVAAFTFAYAFIPNTSVALRPALIGGLVAGLTWKATGLLFTAFVADSAQYSAIYSGFAALLVAMIWLYISWLILLCGGIVAFHTQYPRYLGYGNRRPQLSIQHQEQLGLLLMSLIGRQHLYGGAVWTLDRLADAVDLPWEPLAEQLTCLEKQGFLIALAENGYGLAKDSDKLLLKDILQAIRSGQEQPPLAGFETNAYPATQALLAGVAEGPLNWLKTQTLRDILEEKPITKSSM